MNEKKKATQDKKTAKERKSLFDSKNFLRLFSLLIAVSMWLLVSFVVNPEDSAWIRNVPVNIDLQATAIGKMGLNIIDNKDITVDVYVKGSRYEIGKLKVNPEKLTVLASLGQVTGPGTYNLELMGDSSQNGDIVIERFSPETITLKFDRLVSRHIPVTVELSGYSVSEGNILEKPAVNPVEVVVQGPEVDVAAIDKCIVKLEIDDVLTKTEVYQDKIIFLDKEGNEVDTSHLTVDYDTAEVTIPVLKQKQLKVQLGFLNVPPGFPLDELEYTLSNEYIEVAGPESLMNGLEYINVGHINFKNLDIGTTGSFDVELPSTECVNVENVTSISVEFTNDNLSSKYFNIRDIQLLNVPSNYDVTVTTKVLSNVKIIGRSDILEGLSAGDIVAEIDLSEEPLVAGQYTRPVKIYIPSKGLVWANGDYEAIIMVKEASS